MKNKTEIGTVSIGPHNYTIMESEEVLLDGKPVKSLWDRPTCTVTVNSKLSVEEKLVSLGYVLRKAWRVTFPPDPTLIDEWEANYAGWFAKEAARIGWVPGAEKFSNTGESFNAGPLLNENHLKRFFHVDDKDIRDYDEAHADRITGACYNGCHFLHWLIVTSRGFLGGPQHSARIPG